MRHRKAGRKLGRTTAHREAMLRNLVCSLFEHGRVVTTVPKAKEARRLAERCVTFAKKGRAAQGEVEGELPALKEQGAKLREQLEGAEGEEARFELQKQIESVSGYNAETQQGGLHRVDRITAALDRLGTLDRVTTERLTAVLFDRIRRAGFE